MVNSIEPSDKLGALESILNWVLSVESEKIEC